MFNSSNLGFDNERDGDLRGVRKFGARHKSARQQTCTRELSEKSCNCMHRGRATRQQFVQRSSGGDHKALRGSVNVWKPHVAKPSMANPDELVVLCHDLDGVARGRLVAVVARDHFRSVLSRGHRTREGFERSVDVVTLGFVRPLGVNVVEMPTAAVFRGSQCRRKSSAVGSGFSGYSAQIWKDTGTSPSSSRLFANTCAGQIISSIRNLSQTHTSSCDIRAMLFALSEMELIVNHYVRLPIMSEAATRNMTDNEGATRIVIARLKRWMLVNK